MRLRETGWRKAHDRTYMDLDVNVALYLGCFSFFFFVLRYCREAFGGLHIAIVYCRLLPRNLRRAVCSKGTP